MFLLAKYGTAVTFTSLKLLDFTTKQFRANPTLASGDVKISKDGGALTNLATLPTLSPAASTEVLTALSATEMQCKIASVNFVDQTNPKEWDDNAYYILTYGHASAFLGFDFSVPTVSIPQAQVAQIVSDIWAALRTENEVAGSFGEGVASVQGAVIGAVGDLGSTAKAAVNAEVVDALNVDTYAEVGTEAPAATQTIRKMLAFLYKAYRNRFTQTATQYSLYNDDATTVGQKATTSNDGTTFNRGEVETGP